MIKIKDILEVLEGKFEFVFTGNPDTVIKGYSSLNNYTENTITWVKKKKAVDGADIKNILCAIVQRGTDVEIKNKIICDNSKEVFFFILSSFWGEKRPVGIICTDSYISSGVRVMEEVSIGHHCSLDGDIIIGKGTIIGNNVTMIHRVRIGENCIIHSGAVLGTDGFGYSFDADNIPVKVEHFGGVIIGNRVEIGANACIDRGTIDDTFIDDDTKIDNLSHIAHNVRIGKGVLITAGTVFGGSCTVGDKSYVALGGIVKNQVSIAENSFIGMGAVATDSAEKNTMFFGETTKKVRNSDYRRFL